METIEDLLNVDEIWLINLDRRPDRLEAMQQQLSRLPCRQIHRLSAVDGRQLSDQDIASMVHPTAQYSLQSNERTYHEELTQGAVGCYLSHLKLWDYAIKHNKKLLILEDDVLFGDDFISGLTKKAPHLPEEYDIILLTYSLNDKPIIISEHLVKPHMFFGLSCYMVAPSIRKIRHLLMPMQYQIDGALSFLSPFLDIYAVTPRLIGAGINLKSDVQTPLKRRRFLYQQDICKDNTRWILLSIFLAIVVICLIYLIWKRRC